ncbi:hypothetical protein ACWDA3_27460 [Nonomuraea rubra]
MPSTRRTGAPAAAGAPRPRPSRTPPGAATPAPTGDRLRTTSQFFELLGHDMGQAAAHWRQALSLRTS